MTFAVSEDKISALEHGDIGDVVMRHGPWNSREICVAGPGRDGGGHGVPADRQRRAHPTDFQRGLRPQPTGAQC